MRRWTHNKCYAKVHYKGIGGQPWNKTKITKVTKSVINSSPKQHKNSPISPDFIAAVSNKGVSCLHGPHQSAYTSTRTGTGDSRTNFWKLALVHSNTQSSFFAGVGDLGSFEGFLVPDLAEVECKDGRIIRFFVFLVLFKCGSCCTCIVVFLFCE